MKLTDKQLAKWRQTRQRGMLHFVLTRGVLGWGCTSAVLWAVVTQLREYVFSHYLEFALLLFIGLIVIVPAGFLWVALMWTLVEKKYLKECVNLEPATTAN